MPAHEWTPGYFRVFVSHINAKKKAAAALRDGLRRHHIDAFVAHEDIAATVEWQVEVEDALATCDACIALLSDGFRESPWCDQEVGICYGRGILVLAIHDGLAPYGFLGKFQAFDPRGYSDLDSLYEAIATLFAANDRSMRSMAGALVHRFENSSSFAAARDNFNALTAVPVEAWTAELLGRVEYAHERNGQISSAWYGMSSTVPKQAAQFVESIWSQGPPGLADSGDDADAELLIAALELKENVEELRRRIAHAIPTGVYWRYLLVWDVFKQYKRLLLTRAPDVFEPVSAAYMWFRELNDDVPLGDPIPPEAVDGLTAGVEQLHHATSALEGLIARLKGRDHRS